MVYRAAGRINYVFLLALPLLFAACDREPEKQAVYDASQVKLVSRGGYSYADGKPVNGLVYACNAKGDTLMSGHFRKGREEGVFRYRYADGTLKEIRRYKAGRKTGEHNGWYENGVHRFEYHYKDDLYEGAYKEWFQNGQLYRSQYFVAGHENGPQQVWNADGQIKSNYLIKNGRRYGLFGTKSCVNVADRVVM
jgi:antitoxin component YwqK of YwqJK toxin-antitoxin module